ncbi:hypothetical protein PrNR1418_33270 [Providencia rettgeri]|nr:hypothetical protein PrNR1418_33270 [Providencia rettgeri]
MGLGLILDYTISDNHLIRKTKKHVTNSMPSGMWALTSRNGVYGQITNMRINWRAKMDGVARNAT